MLHAPVGGGSGRQPYAYAPRGRRETLETAETKGYETQLLSLKASAKWLMDSDLLGPYSPAGVQLYRT